MSIHPIHSNIKKHIIEELGQAKFLIYASVAWFTDFDIYQILINKSREGLIVEIIIRDDSNEPDPINFYTNNSLGFLDLENAGGKVYLLKNSHTKYAIIDLNTVISGSYNWTYGAHMKEDGLERVEIAKDEFTLAHKDAEAFIQLRNRATRIYLTTVGRYHPKIVQSVPGIKDHIVGLVALDSHILKLNYSTGGFAYCTKDQVIEGAFVKSFDNEIIISSDHKLVDKGGICWIEKVSLGKAQSNEESLESEDDFPKIFTY